VDIIGGGPEELVQSTYDMVKKMLKGFPPSINRERCKR
jgi:hypothetical protein